VADAAPDLPFFYYHIPELTGVILPIHEFYGMATSEIPNFRGVKYSSLDTLSLGYCLKFKQDHPNHQLFWGKDGDIIGALDHGIEAAIGSTYNFIPELARDVMECQKLGDRHGATKTLFKIQCYVRFINERTSGSPLAVQKETMSFISKINMGPVRLPLLNVTCINDFQEELSDILRDFHDS